MTHKMILMSHDFKEVLKIVVARRKASIAQVEERIFRTDEVGASIASAGSILTPSIDSNRDNMG
jgi:hypothetical protein